MKIILTMMLVLFSSLGLAAERIVDGNRTTENVPRINAQEISRASQYNNIRSASALSWSSEGDSILISTRFGATNQLHLVSEPLGTRNQLTFYAEPVTNAAFSPTSDQVAFIRDTGGDEDFQAYLLNLNSGFVSQLTQSNSRNSNPLFSNDGRSFAYMSNRDDSSRFDVWVAQTNRPQSARMLVQGTGFYWQPVAWSPDNSKMLILQRVSAADTRPFIVDLASGAMSRIGPDDEKAAYSEGRFTKDGEGLYLATDLDSEFAHLRYVDLTSGSMSTLTADIPWGVVSMDMSHDGDTLAFSTNEDGISRIYLLNTQTNTYDRVDEIPIGVIPGIHFSPTDDRLALTLTTATSPADVYVYGPSDNSLVRWTKSEIGGLSEDLFVESELVHFPTFDSNDGGPSQIPAFVYKPKNTSGKLPVVISIHGGPEGQVRPGFSSRVQQSVNELGVIYITPNVRGSLGYGKTYLDLDNDFKREDSVQDIGALLDWIETQPDMDSDRVGVIGGSYGGYMVLASMTHFNDRIRAGVELFGISNFSTFLQNTSPYRQDHRRQEYGDERLPEMNQYFTRTAPMNNVSKITKPLFVLQGANDPRVPASESEQIVEKVQANGGDVWYLLFDDEGHGFRKKNNNDFTTAATSAFFREHLLD